MKVHIGKKIRDAVKHSGLSVTEFARLIGYSRRNAYAIFEKESVSTALLLKISDVLGKDLFSHYAQESSGTITRRWTTGEPEMFKEYRENHIREMLREIEHLKEINGLLKIQLRKTTAGKKK